LVYSIWSEPLLHRETGALSIYAGTGEELLGELLATTLGEAAALARGDFTDDEFELARRQFRGATALELEATDVRSSRNARSVLAHGRPLPYEEFDERLTELTCGDARRVAAASLGSAELCVAAIGPVSEDRLGELVDDALRASATA
jgi:predicted Zn-dependent peptidase